MTRSWSTLVADAALLLFQNTRWSLNARRLAERIREVSRAETVTIVLNQLDGTEWQGAFVTHLGPEPTIWPWHPPLPDEIAARLNEGQIWHDPSHRVLFIPILLDERWIGTLAFVFPSSPPETSEGMEALEQVARLIGEAERHRREALQARWRLVDASEQVSDFNLYVRLYAELAEAMLLVAPDGTLLDCNPSAEQLFGLRRDTLLAHSFAALIGGEEQFTSIMQTVRKYGHWIGRLPFRHPDEERAGMMEVTIIPLDEASSKTTSQGFLAICKDVSDVERAFRRVRSAEMRLRTLVENAPDIIFVMNAEGMLLALNPAFERLTGWSVNEWLGRSVLELIHEDDMKVVAQVRRQMMQQETLQATLRLRRKDGTPLWIEMMALSVFDEEQGRPLYHGIARDFTRRKETEDRLRAQRELFRNLVEIARVTSEHLSLEATLRDTLEVATRVTEAASASVFLLDSQGDVIHSILARGDTPEEERFRLAREALRDGVAGLAVRSGNVIRVDDIAADPRWKKFPDAPFQRGSALAVPIVHQGQALGVLTLMSGEPYFFDKESEALMQAAADQMALAFRNAQLYEEQRRLVAELQIARDAAEAASRAKSAFLANISHELRTPLTIIIGYAEMLIDELDPSDDDGRDLIHSLERILTSAQQLLRLVNGLLDIARIETGVTSLQLQEVEIEQLVEEVQTEAESLAAKQRNRLRIEVAADSGTIVADAVKLRQILLNLLSNAAKFTEDGTITLRVWRETRSKGEQIVFEVEDTGIGIGKQELQTLFDPFSRTTTSRKRPSSGRGLGLAISKRFADLMGGDIRVRSEEGKGSTFTVQIPASQHASQSDESAQNDDERSS